MPDHYTLLETRQDLRLGKWAAQQRGAVFGAIGAALLGSIGVAGAATFAIPVIVLAAGGME